MQMTLQGKVVTKTSTVEQKASVVDPVVWEKET